MKNTIYSNYYWKVDESGKCLEDHIYNACFECYEDEYGWESVEEMKTKDPHFVEQYLYDCLDLDYSMFKDEMKNFLSDKRLLVKGSVGRWNGTNSGYEVINTFDELMDSISFCDYIEVIEEKNRLYVNGSHHDGSVHLEIKVLTDKGDYLLNSYDYQDYNLDKIFNCNIYTKLPKYTKFLRGDAA